MRRGLKIALVFLATALGAGALVLGWLLGTTAGMAWVLAQLPNWTPVVVKAGAVQGRLAGPLGFRDLDVSWPGGRAVADRLALDWSPLGLLNRNLLVTSLEGGGVRIELQESPASPEKASGPIPAWPRMTGWPLRWDAAAEQVAVTGLVVEKNAEPVFSLDRGALKIAWKDGVLTLLDIDLQTPDKSLAGGLRAGFGDPSLQGDLVAVTEKSSPEPRRWSLRADLKPTGASSMRGPARFHASDLGGIPVDLKATLSLTGSRLEIEDLQTLNPEGKGLVTGNGYLEWADLPVAWKADLILRDIDLAEVAGGRHTRLGGRVQVTGKGTSYQGNADILNLREGWEGVRLAGKILGDGNGVSLSALDGTWLGGSLDGKAEIRWSPAVEINTLLSIREIDPGLAVPDWPGSVSLDVRGTARKGSAGEWQAQTAGKLLNSTLRGQPLRGEWDVAWAGGDLRVNRLDVAGDGFIVHGSGSLANRLNLRLEVARLNTILPGATGNAKADGWLRWDEHALTGEFTALANSLAFKNWSARKIDLKFRGTDPPLHMEASASGSGLSLDGKTWDTFDLALTGAPDSHRAELRLSGSEGQFWTVAEGGYEEGAWRGTVENLTARAGSAPAWVLVAPFPLQAGPVGLDLGPADFENAAGGKARFALSLGDMYRTGKVAGDWWHLDLGVLDPWLPMAQDWKAAGTTTGGIEAGWDSGGKLNLAGNLDLEGTVTGPDRVRVDIEKAEGFVRWDSKGLGGSLKIKTLTRGSIALTVDSDEPGRLGIPSEGNLAADWDGFDLETLQPWLGEGLVLTGMGSGHVDGQWRSAGPFSLKGRVLLTGGKFIWQTGDGTVTAPIQDAAADWSWEGESFGGHASLTLGEVGKLQVKWDLPLPARFPLAFAPDGALNAKVAGQLRERGLLEALLPGLVQESHGTVRIDLAALGTWKDPRLMGEVDLADAGAYLPGAGIRLENVGLQAQLEGNSISILSARVESGKGFLEAKGMVDLEQWRPVRTDLEISGERFQAVDLPGFSLLVSPNLKIAGTPDQFSVRGEVTVPELKITRLQEQPALRQHADVVIMEKSPPEQIVAWPALDLQVKVVLGDHVLVKMGGIDARLVGDAVLQQKGDQPLAAKGEIRVKKGKFARYGVDLDIVRGRILFAGPVERPTLDILALRQIEDVKAGVRITGNAKQPVISLYSDPAMDDIDKLSYVVLGHPMGESGGGQTGLLMAAAGGLLSQGESASLQSQLQKATGLDLIAVEGGEEPEQSVVTLGKYLSPRLYVSFGQSLFTPTSEFRVRYTLSKHFEVESKVGDTSGADLYYKIEFD